jgi:very-short-patch-repair endonuclease
MRRILETDRAIAELAGRQAGVVARRQLLALGLSAAAIDRRVRCGRLHTLHRGVFAVGHTAIGFEGRRWAVLLRVGPSGALSDASAAHAWGLRGPPAVIHVTVPPGGRVAPRGARLHHRRPLRGDELTRLAGLPITTAARTLLDLAAGGERERALELAVDRAERMRLLDFADLHALLARYPRRVGTGRMRALLARYEPHDTRSALEELVRALCVEHGLPRPAVNVVVAGRVRDFAWADAHLVVEADSYGFHRSPASFGDDRERDVELTLAGWRTLRFTWAQVTQRPRYVVDAIVAAIRFEFTSPRDANPRRVPGR